MSQAPAAFVAFKGTPDQSFPLLVIILTLMKQCRAETGEIDLNCDTSVQSKFSSYFFFRPILQPIDRSVLETLIAGFPLSL